MKTDNKKRFYTINIQSKMLKTFLGKIISVIINFNMNKKHNWHSLDVKEVLNKLGTTVENGLNSSDIFKIQEKYGKNVFKKKKDFGIWGKIFLQFKNPLIFILLVAVFATFFLGEKTDSLVIFLALFINTLIGTFQENRASKAFEKLSKQQQKHATVIRDGKKSVVLVENLVVGDIVILNSGSYVPADIRLIEERDLLINESVLTGEWVDVVKDVGVVETLEAEKYISKQTNMVWMGSLVSGGNGTGVVVEIGDKTEMGKIAQGLNNLEEEKTPIKENLERLARFLSIIVLVSLVVIFFLGLLRGEPVTEMLLVAIAVAIATMPEGLPIAVTSVLAVGMNQILKRGGLVRNLLAAETLGSTTVILTDKTGTITGAKMVLDKIFTLKTIKEEGDSDETELLKMSVLSSEAFIDEAGGSEEIIVRGRPLEKAIVMAGIDSGFVQNDLLKESERLDFLFFESKNGFRASLNKNGDKNRLFVSGIPELLLENSSYVYYGGEKKKVTKEILKEFSKIQKERGEEGSKFIALAYLDVDWDKIPVSRGDDAKKILEKLVFVGIATFNDPIRPDAKESIEKAKSAGTRVIMITGDNPSTASTIAEKVGIIKKGEEVLTGMDVDKMSDIELFDKLKTVNVFARMVPSQKLRISKILQKNGEVVAMTGDGVNDALALQGADIGIAMESGSEVSKEASDLILLKGDFGVITFAIEEGRRIIDNLRKIIGYLLSTSFTEVFVIGGALVAGYPLPILPTQILWSNIIEEGLMNFAFVFEPGEENLMKRDPRLASTREVMTKKLKAMIIIVGVTTGIFLMALYWFLMQTNIAIEEARTIMFVATSIESIFFALSFKSFENPLWKEKIFSNKYLIISLLVSIFFLLIALFVPFIRDILSLTVLTGGQLVILGVIGMFNLFVIETAKYLVFKTGLIK